MLEGMKNFKSEMMEENESTGFKALNGKYKAVVKNYERFKKEGESEKGPWKIDKLQVDFQINETVSGDKGDNRYVRKEFDLNPYDESWVEKTLQSFANMIHTITREEPNYKYEDGDGLEETVGKLVIAADPIIGKVANLTIYPNKEKKDWTAKDGTVHKKGDIRTNYRGDEEMVVLVVAEHKEKGAAKKATAQTATVQGEF